MSTSLLYKCDYITVGVDFYSIYQWPEVKREQTIVDGKIKYFRIGLKSYRKKENDTDDEFLKNICDINISYIKNNEKKLYLYKTNILDLYKYLNKNHKKDESLKYIKKICKRFYEPKNIKRNVTIDDIPEDIIHNNFENPEILFIDKKYRLINIKIIDINKNPPILKTRKYIFDDIYIDIVFLKKVVSSSFSFYVFSKLWYLHNPRGHYHYNILYNNYILFIIYKTFIWLIYTFFNIN